MLSLFQQEWDAIMLQVHGLRVKNHELGMELSTAMYENDAAKRVISRMIKERDDARAELAAFRPSEAPRTDDAKRPRTDEPHAFSSPAAIVPPLEDDKMDVDTAALPILDESIIKVFDDTALELSTIRKKRKTPPTLATSEAIASYVPTKLNSTHGASHGGVQVFDLFEGTIFEKKVIFLLGGGRDGKITVRSFADGDSVQVFTMSKAHKQNVSVVVWGSNGTFYSGGLDGKIKTWDCHETNKGYSWKETHTESYEEPVTGITMHPSGKYYARSSESTCALIAIDGSQEIATFNSGSAEIDFHPDGLLLAVGSADGKVRIYDVKSRSLVLTFEYADAQGSVLSIAFSENGYIMASSNENSSKVFIWDLRSQKMVHDIDSEELRPIVCWDGYCAYLGVCAGNHVKIYANKKWTHVASFDIGTDARALRFTTDAADILVAGSDGKYALLTTLSKE